MAGKAKSTAAPPPEVLTQVPEWASTTAIAQLIGRSTRRVQQLTQDGVLSTEVPPGGGARRYRTARTIQDYMAWQEQKVRDELSGSTLEELTIKKLQAEVELKESQGALHKLKTAIAEGKVSPGGAGPEGSVRLSAAAETVCRPDPRPCGGHHVRLPGHGSGPGYEKRSQKGAGRPVRGLCGGGPHPGHRPGGR